MQPGDPARAALVRRGLEQLAELATKACAPQAMVATALAQEIPPPDEADSTAYFRNLREILSGLYSQLDQFRDDALDFSDMDLLARSGVGRDINRHHFSHSEIGAALATPLVQRLCALIRLRNTHAAFGGTFELTQADEHQLCIRWVSGTHSVELQVDLAARRLRVLDKQQAIEALCSATTAQAVCATATAT